MMTPNTVTFWNTWVEGVLQLQYLVSLRHTVHPLTVCVVWCVFVCVWCTACGCRCVCVVCMYGVCGMCVMCMCGYVYDVYTCVEAKGGWQVSCSAILCFLLKRDLSHWTWRRLAASRPQRPSCHHSATPSTGIVGEDLVPGSPTCWAIVPAPIIYSQALFSRLLHRALLSVPAYDMESRSYKEQEAMHIPGCICDAYLASSSPLRMFAALTDNSSGEQRQGKRKEHAERAERPSRSCLSMDSSLSLLGSESLSASEFRLTFNLSCSTAKK